MNTDQKLSAMFEEFPLSRVLPSHFQQLATCHPEIGQREHRCKLCGVLLQTTVAHLNETKLQFDHPKRMLYFGAHARVKCISWYSTGQTMSVEISSTPDYGNDSPGRVEPQARASGAPLCGFGLDLFLAPERELSSPE